MNARKIRIGLFALVALATLAAWAPSPPPGTQTLFSQSFQLDGDCHSDDMVYRWQITSGPTENQFIRAWTPNDISIRGAELTVMSPPQGALWWMVGNSANADTMLFVPGNELHGVNWYPAGTSFQFPGTSNAASTNYMDLHGGCISGHVTIMLTFYYTLN